MSYWYTRLGAYLQNGSDRTGIKRNREKNLIFILNKKENEKEKLINNYAFFYLLSFYFKVFFLSHFGAERHT